MHTAIGKSTNHCRGGLDRQQAGAQQQQWQFKCQCVSRPGTTRHHPHTLAHNGRARLTNTKTTCPGGRRLTYAVGSDASAAGTDASTALPPGIDLRPGTSADYLPALRSMVAEK